jgi:uncharacterized protein
MKVNTALVFCCFALTAALTPAFGFDGVNVTEVTTLAKEGNPEAQMRLGVLYSTGLGGVKMDKKAAVKWYEKAAAQGFPMAVWNLGFMYVRGEGVEVDYKKARELFQKAAEAGLTEAQYDLGMMYLQGVGMDQNLPEAEKWLRKADGQGSREAKKMLKELESAKLL